MLFRTIVSVIVLTIAAAFSTVPKVFHKHASSSLLRADVEVIFPNGKKAKAATGRFFSCCSVYVSHNLFNLNSP